MTRTKSLFPRFRFVLALVATLALTGYTTSLEDVYDTDQRIAKVVWKQAYKMSRYSHRGVHIPSVRRSSILNEKKFWGLYWNSSYVIWVQDDLKGSRLWLTIFHEHIHVLQAANRATGDSPFAGCVMERESLDLTNEYALKLGAPSMVRTLERWKELYGC